MHALSGDLRSRAERADPRRLRPRPSLQRRAHGDGRDCRRRAGACAANRFAAPMRRWRSAGPPRSRPACAGSALRRLLARRPWHDGAAPPPWPGGSVYFLRGSGRARDDCLVVDVDGFEGPLDLLLELARDQKVDLAKISILALAEQYLAFVEDGAAAAAGDRRRLSRDGGMARLPEIAPAAARRGRGRGAERRRAGAGARRAAEPSRGDPRGRPAADGVRAARHRRLPARHAGADFGAKRRRSGTRASTTSCRPMRRFACAGWSPARIRSPARQSSRCRRRASG